MSERPRYSIFIGYEPDGEIRYYFQDHDPDFKTGREKGINYGLCFHYQGRGFTYKRKAHDAIEFCKKLNAEAGIVT
jgi:hypothetical protein